MKKNFIIFFNILLLYNLFAEENIYKKFISINNSLTQNSYLIEQRLETINKDENTQTVKKAKSIFCNNKEFTFLPDEKKLSILSTPSGYWMKNSKTKTPIKISGNFSVDEIQMQDLLKIDYENDYKIEEQNKEFFLLKRVNKKNLYAWLKLSYDEKNNKYLIFALDNKMNLIKKIIYESENIDDVICFSKIKIYNIALNTNIENIFITESIKPIKVSKSLFSSEYMDELLKCLK